MSEEFLGDRRKALEEEFFAKHNRQLLQQLLGDKKKPSRPRLASLMLLYLSNWRPSI
jgi:hypothetical protein